MRHSSSYHRFRPFDAARRFPMQPNLPSTRMILWIDEVGGFWICGGSRVAIGPAGPRGEVDLPLLADLSRPHAVLQRDGESCLLQALRPTRVNNKPVAGWSLVRHADTIELGGSVKMRYTRPHPLSNTGRFDYLSPHRTQPSTDAVLWMGETCVLGPAEHNHVVCRRWTRDVVLSRRADSWYCRIRGEFTVNGEPRQDESLVPAEARIAGEDFSLTLECV